ncbi:unnamed protein product [Blepharisma stoltei]|uniref:Uncharacterized protein n=1 Tax=Blepharisma stoltei TaxID=1481888 RepID=A0AAU9JB98_9CILI|nr:unnamed protein product [Blepharisma stoltei]
MKSNEVIIEHCKDCKTHNWCTNHDEEKYVSLCEKLKEEIESLCPEVLVLINQETPMVREVLYGASVYSSPKSIFPRLGAFEVYFRGDIVVSKLQSARWPNVRMVAQKIRRILDGKEASPYRPNSVLQNSGFDYGKYSPLPQFNFAKNSWRTNKSMYADIRSVRSKSIESNLNTIKKPKNNSGWNHKVMMQQIGKKMINQNFQISKLNDMIQADTAANSSKTNQIQSPINQSEGH